MTITVGCGQCAREFTYTFADMSLRTLKKGFGILWDEMKAAGWVVQKNGDIVDCYCSKRCAR